MGTNYLHMILAVAVLALSGCFDGPADGARGSSGNQRPLQPLIYTERPDRSVQAAAVGERRLMRQLLDGADEDAADWGTMEPTSAPLPPLGDAGQLGQAVFGALVSRDEARWDQLFVAPADYAGMVRVELDDARSFVDDIQAKSQPSWKAFQTEHPSEVADGGLAELLVFDGLELGKPRNVGGSVVPDSDDPHSSDGQRAAEVAQYWGNVLRLRLGDTDVYFELPIAKVLRIAHPRDDPDKPRLALASAVEMSPKLQVYLRAGLHLKPQLLATREYPYPLAVGNFWRYRRRLADRPDQAAAPTSAHTGARADSAAAATESLLEVSDVDRYGSWRLVTLRRSYDDDGLTTVNQHWLVTARRIYGCTRACQTQIGDLNWLLGYLAGHTPIFRFPLRLGDQWGRGGGDGAGTKHGFEVGRDWHDVDVPAGSYVNTVEISGRGPLGASDPFYRGRGQTRYFAHGRGIVRRVLHPRSSASDGVDIVETLVESRVIPHAAPRRSR